MVTLKNVLVATDFDPASDTALAYGRELARMSGATLHVLHVVQDISTRLPAVEGYVPDIIEWQSLIEEQARKQLQALVREDDRRELRARVVTRTSLGAAPEIVSYAKDAGIDLIVMGTHGRRAMAHLFMGSVAEKVVRTAPCPVLTVRSPEHEFVAPDALQTIARV